MINIIYGIGARDNANVFVNDTRLAFDDLNTYGWVLLILSCIQLLGGVSLMSGKASGQVIGIAAGSTAALRTSTGPGAAVPAALQRITGGRPPVDLDPKSSTE